MPDGVSSAHPREVHHHLIGRRLAAGSGRGAASGRGDGSSLKRPSRISFSPAWRGLGFDGDAEDRLGRQLFAVMRGTGFWL
jgi:hypothetical protein